jgi:PEP-CTERM motif
MNFMQNVRRIGLVGLVLVASSVSAFADTIVGWDSQTSSTPKVIATVGATNSASGGAGTEISLTNARLVNPVDNDGNPLLAAPAYLTFDLKSTSANTGSTGNLNQTFSGFFTIKDGSGNLLVGSTGITAQINQQAGRSVVALNTNFTTDPTGSLVTAGNFVSPFGLDINLSNVSGLAATTVNGVSTTTWTSARVSSGDVNGTVGAPVPEPSTFALLGLGVAGLAVGAYRRRNAAV